MSHGKQTNFARKVANTIRAARSRDRASATSDVVLILRDWLAASGANSDDASTHYRRSPTPDEHVPGATHS